MAGLFGRIAAGLPAVAAEVKSVDFSDSLMAAILGQTNAKSGVSVNVDTALKTTTFLAGIRVIAEGVAAIPLKLYREKANGGKEVAKTEMLHKRLSRRPNDWMTSFEFRESLTMHAVACGAGYAYKVRNSRGEILELLPVAPQNRRTRQTEDYGLVVDVSDGKGLIGTFPARDFLRVNGPSWNGLIGMEIISLAREALGLAIATEENHARLFSNGARPGGILSVEGNLTVEAKDRLRNAWQQAQSQLGNAFKTAVLPASVKWHPMGMKGVDAQHLETRRFQIEEICRAIRVFPQMVGYADKTATFASAEAFFLAHVIHTLLPWVKRWEEAIDRDLIGDDVNDLFAKFSVQGLLRGDTKTRSEYYAQGILNGWLTRNEARSFEELDPLPGLDQPLIPLNMGTQEERDAIARETADAVKSLLIGHNGGPPLDGDAMDVIVEEIEAKVGRVLSSRNERRIRDARDGLDQVLASLPAPTE